MDRRLDKAINRCTADLARAVRDGTPPEFDSLWHALELLDAVHPEGTEKLKFEWLQQEVLRRFLGRLETRLQARLGPNPAVADELKTMFADVLESVGQ
jgi:hypothetical protein